MTALFILIGIFVGAILITVIFNKLLHIISIKLGWIYWPLTMGFAVLLFFMASPNNTFSIFNPGNYEDFSACWGVFFMHFVHAYFLIPMLGGESGTYFTTAYEYDHYNYWTDTVYYNKREVENNYYTPGWWKKLIAQAVIGLICFLIVWLSSFSLLWVILVAELVYSGYLSIIAIYKKIRRSRSRRR